jgi:acyl carrier protein
MTTSTKSGLHAADLRQAVLDVLHRVAPEFAPEELRSEMPLRDQVDLGSLDWANFLDALRERLGVEIAEADYAKLTTFDELLEYLAEKLR